MKNLTLFIFSMFILVTQIQAKTVTVTGSSFVCPGTLSNYSAHTDFQGSYVLTFKKLTFTVTGGTFVASPMYISNTTLENNGHTYTVYANQGTSWSGPVGDFVTENAYVNWDNDQKIGTVTATYYYDYLAKAYSLSNSITVNVGVSGTVSQVNALPSICLGSTSAYQVSSSASLAGTGANTFQWSGAVSGTGSSAQFYPAESGNVLINVRMVNTGCSNAYSPWYTLSIPRTATPPTGYPTMSSTGKYTSEATFSFTPTGGGYATQISIDGGQSFYDGSVIYVTQGHSQTVYVRSVNDCGIGAAMSFLLIAPPCRGCIVREMASNVDGNRELIISPNPATDNLSVEIPEIDQTVTVSIFDLSGQLVKSVEVVGGSKNTLDIQALSKGMYVVHVVSKDGSSLNEMRKVIVAK
jgi:hypothetical protein